MTLSAYELSVTFRQVCYKFAQSNVIDILRESGNDRAIVHYQELLDGNHWPAMVIPFLKRVSKRYPLAMQQVENLEAGKYWALYSVRRIFADHVKVPYRQTRILHQGDYDSSMAILGQLGDAYGMPPQLTHLSNRIISIPRPMVPKFKKNGEVATDRSGNIKMVQGERPFVEEMFVVLPATVYPKARITDVNYQLKWFGITGELPANKGLETNGSEKSIVTVTRRKAKRVRH